jgi:TnpA family transposase
VVRTIFLLRYLSSAELRHTIQAATNKSEAFRPNRSRRGYTREAAIRPNGVTPQRTRNDRIAASDTAEQSGDAAKIMTN